MLYSPLNSETNLTGLKSRLGIAMSEIKKIGRPNLSERISKDDLLKILKYVSEYIKADRFVSTANKLNNEVNIVPNIHIPKNTDCPRACEIVLTEGQYRLYVFVGSKMATGHKNSSIKIADNVGLAVRIDELSSIKVVKKCEVPTPPTRQTQSPMSKLWDMYFHEASYVPVAVGDINVHEKQMGCFYQSKGKTKLTLYSNHAYSIKEILKASPNLSFGHRLEILSQALKGLKSLHEQGFTLNGKVQLTNLLNQDKYVKWSKYERISVISKQDAGTLQASNHLKLSKEQKQDCLMMQELAAQLLYNCTAKEWQRLPKPLKLASLEPLSDDHTLTTTTVHNVIANLSMEARGFTSSGIAKLPPSNVVRTFSQNQNPIPQRFDFKI